MIVEWCTMLLLERLNYIVLWLLGDEEDDDQLAL
jgi:hypothetical protein